MKRPPENTFTLIVCFSMLVGATSFAGEGCKNPPNKSPLLCFPAKLSVSSGQRLPAAISKDLEKWRVSAWVEGEHIPLNQFQTWTLRVLDQKGQPVSGLRVFVNGGMPEHDHALPTQPKMLKESAAGEYQIGGFQFSMFGNWLVNFHFKVASLPLVAQIDFNLAPPSVKPVVQQSLPYE